MRAAFELSRFDQRTSGGPLLLAATSDSSRFALLAAFLGRSERRPSCVTQSPFCEQLSHRFSIKRHRAARWLIAPTFYCVCRLSRPVSSFDPWTSGGPTASRRAEVISSRPPSDACLDVRFLSLRFACLLPSSVEARGDPAAPRKPLFAGSCCFVSAFDIRI